MRILCVGAGGVGSAAAKIAARRPFFDAWVMADYDLARAERAAADTSDPRFSAAQIDASSAEAVAALARQSGCDIVFNAVDPRFVLPIFNGALAAGCNYLDMAMSLSSPHPTEPFEKTGVKLGDEQFAAAVEGEEPGRLALVGIGVEPGLSDIFAKYASDHLFRDIEEI